MYMSKPVSAWPSLTIHWTLDPNEWVYSFDGELPDWVKNDVPILGWAPIAEIHNHLVINSKVNNSQEFWEGAAEDKAGNVISGWAIAKPMSPPILMLWPPRTLDEIVLAGGNHRFNVANLAGGKHIPFLAIYSHKAGLTALLPSVVWLP